LTVSQDFQGLLSKTSVLDAPAISPYNSAFHSNFPDLPLMSSTPQPLILSIASTFTAEPLGPVFGHWLGKMELRASLEFAPFNQVLQQLLDPTSRLSSNRGGLNLVLVRAGDMPGAAAELADALTASIRRDGVETWVCICPEALTGSPGDAFARELRERTAGLAGLDLLDATESLRFYPVADVFDAAADEAACVPYTEEMFAALATWLARRVAARKRRPYKVIAVDCDHTLWSGVCGEAGACGVVIDAGRRRFQELLLEKRAEGFLLCLVSKNHPDDVEAVFRDHPDMAIRRDAFAAAAINWEPKSSNLRELAQQLHLGLDSFVMLDDNPAEIAEIAANAPAVMALRVPEDSAELPGFVRNLWVLDGTGATGEDLQRAEFYQTEVRREELRASTAGFSEFLENLGLEVDFEPLDARNVERAHQLTLRTNQFTSHPRIIEAAELLNGGLSAELVRVRDRFGDYGAVGLMLGRIDGPRLVVETFLLSCRALGRGVEHRMLRRLGEFAVATGIGEVAIRYKDSGRNQPCHAFLESLPEGQWVDNLRVVPALAAARCQMLPVLGKPRLSAGEAAVPLANPAAVARAAMLPDVAAILAEVRGSAKARPDLSEPFAQAHGGTELEIASIWRDVLGLREVGRNDRFFDLGGTSLQLVRVHAAMQRAFNKRFELVRLFENPTVAAQAAMVNGAGSTSIAEAPLDNTGSGDSQAIAVIGMALRLPGASTPEELWRNLRDGVESISHFDRSELDVPARDDEDVVCARGLLDPDLYEGVDGGLFGIVPREAEMIDPQQRVFLELCWEAVERAGYPPDAAEEQGGRVGVYAGCYYDTYLPHHILSDPEMHRRHLAEAQVGALQVEFGNDKDHIATRVAFKMNLHGPSLTVQTACSTSLVAVAHAMMALRSGQCEMALAGGITITVPQKRGFRHVEGGMLSPDGHCRPFDAHSAGTVFSNGGGVVMLKRLDAAIRDGDTIHAVLRGYGLNNDGGVKHSYAAPSVDGQADVIRRAHRDAGIDPRTITYIEAHGTATPLGDPIEIAGLTDAFRSATADHGFCAIGSLKSNLGHLDTAAGVCGLIKTVLSLKHRELPRVLHFTEPNPRIDFASSPFFVNDRLRPWEPAPGAPRRAGVSSFGVGGTNAHVIVEEAPPVRETGVAAGGDRVLVFSARDDAALEQLAGRLAAHATQADAADFAAAARTLALGRKSMSRRSAVVAGSWAEAAELLAAGNRVSATAAGTPPGLVWMFPGQGAQHPGMCADLYAAEPDFKADIDRCAKLLEPELGEDLRETLFAPEGNDAAERLKHTVLAQPAIFVVEYALARQWQRWGITPELMLGHSVGEFTAACLAGVFPLEDGLKILAARGRLMGEVERGSMLSVRLPAGELVPRLPADLDMAAENGPSLCVVAGESAAIARFAAELEADGVAVRELHTSHAFHSRMMDGVVARFREVIAAAKLSAPGLPILSTVTGKPLSAAEATDPDYWASHLRHTVLFHRAVDAAAAEKPGRLFLEVGPGQTLTMLARQTAGKRAVACLASCEHPAAEAPDRRRMLSTLGELWCHGVDIDWKSVHSATPARRVSLPTYPFQRRRAWLPCRLLDQPLPAAVQVETSDSAEPVVEATEQSPAAPAAGTAQRLRQVLEDLSGVPADEMTDDSGFLELGFDSLLLTQAARVLQNTFGVAISFRDLMRTTPTVGLLAAHLEKHGVAPTSTVAPAAKPAAVKPQAAAPAAPAATEPESGVSGPRTRIDRSSTSAELTPQQQAHLAELVARYNSRTRGSKELTQHHRQWLADPRTVNGFNRLWKEMVYQIVARRMKGCRMWDVDGNEYIDMVNGFGPNFLGHSPDYVSEAIRQQLETGLEIGPQCEAAMETAKLFCEVTGNERVCFLNTGSEAVQAAMRIARTVTGRDKILVFDKDYHGNFDPVLVRSVGAGARRRTLPLAPGIPASAVQDVIVVPWGKPEALEMIREVAHELAAVLVEPVQSRQPEWIPVDFVHEVQRIGQEHGFLLVFDEVITGLRQGLRGAQDLYEIKPDLATYGKVFGGGALPIGIIAGKSEYMDTFDGGHWQYGDDSFPEKEVTFFAGTFVRLPLAMAACRAVLTHLKQKGPDYWLDIAKRATRLARTVDRMFRDDGIDIRMVNTGSQMYLRIGDNAKHGNLLFYHLREKGVFAMEGLPFYLTAEHSDADVDFVIDAFRRSITELQNGGFFPKRPAIEGVEVVPGVRGPFPMTEPMVEIYLAAMMSREANLAFNEMLQLRLRGAVDVPALRAALQDLVDRHDALRMRVAAGHSTAFVIDPEREVWILDEDFRSAADPEAALHECGVRQRETAFDLENGPLFRVVVARLADDVTVLQLAAHHIACDGWSFEVLIKDFTRCYESRAKGRMPSLPPPPSIVDRALREAAADTTDEAALGWWRERFAAGVEELEMPLRRSYGSVPEYASATCERMLDRAALDHLRKAAGRCGVTLNSALLAGFQALLHRLSGQENFVVAFPSAGQKEYGDEHLVGHCVNFLPLPAAVDPKCPFKDLALQVSTAQFDALDHGKATYGRLLRELKVPRDGGRRPLVEFIFNFEPSGDPGSFGGLESAVETVPARYSNSTIFLNAMQTPEGLLLSSTYNRQFIDPGTMQSWLHVFETLLLAAAADPSLPVGEISLLDSAGAAELAAWRGNGRSAADGSVAGAFRDACTAHASRTALVWPGGSCTYAELGARVAGFAAALRQCGVCPGERVAVRLKRGPDAIAALLGILEAGACYVPLDPGYPEARTAEILLDAAVRVLVSDEPSPLKEITRLAPSDVGQALPAVISRTSEDPAYVMYTSGSTGKPKGVIIPQRGILRLVRGADFCGFGPDEVFMQCSTLAFDAATFEIFGALLNGGSLVLPPPDATLAEIAAELRQHKVTNVFFTTGLFDLLIDEDPEDLQALRRIITGGEVASVDHFRRAFELLPHTELIHAYGPTENTTFTTCHKVRREDLDGPTIPIGKPITGTCVRIVDPQGREVPVGVPGELQCGGAGLALGYLERPELTAERFIENRNWYRSGDLCRWTADGLIEFVGRLDDQVKVRGFRIEPGEIETALEAHPAVRQAKVAVRGTGASGKRLLAWICPAAGIDPDRADLRNWLSARLPKFMQPDAIEIIPSMPLNANGKVDVKALPEPHSPVAVDAGSQPPTGPTEEKLAAIWLDILGVAEIRRDDAFFDLGGNSLAGLRMFARIHRDFGVSLPLATLLHARTVRTLAAAIDAAKMPAVNGMAQTRFVSAEIGHIAAIRSGGDLPPVIAIHGGDGGILFYEDLARRLPEGRPFLAIESPDLSTSGEIGVESIETTANNYIQLLREIRPHGPYLLAGYSFGGVVAWEMAAQLAAAGEEIQFLGLIDTMNPAVPVREYSLPERVSVFWKSRAEEPLIGRIQSLAARFRTGVETNLRVRSEVASARSELAEAHSDLRGVQLREAHHQAMLAYRPKHLDVRVTLFRADSVNDKYEHPADYGWDSVAGELHIVDVPGEHFSLFGSENIPVLARRFSEQLPSPDPKPGSRESDLAAFR
jgi:amino acid adenylation domain-containing protein/FkbH-like protein